MKGIKHILLFLLITSCLPCFAQPYIFESKYPEAGKLSVTDAGAFEQNRSTEIDLNYSVSIGEGIYPNRHHFELGKPKTFQKEEKGFTLETEYYFSKKDSTVKVILYQWDEPKQKSDDISVIIAAIAKADKKDLNAKYELFNKKFAELSGRLTGLLGRATKTNIHKGTGTFRDDLFWTNNGRNAYLFMFGNDGGYRQIRLAVYSD